jgi:hypothetical protein
LFTLLKRFLPLLGLLLLWPSSSYAQASAFVQLTTCGGTGTFNCAAFGSNIGVGNTEIAILITKGSQTATPTMTSSRGTFALQAMDASCKVSNPDSDQVFTFELDGATAGADQPAVQAGSGVQMEGGVFEISALAASSFDKTMCNSAASGTSITSNNTATTSFANEMLLGMCASGTNTPAVSGSWTSAGTGSNNYIERYEYQHVVATGTYAATCTQTTAKWAAAIATFKDTSQAGGGSGGGGFGGTGGIGGKAGFGYWHHMKRKQ